MPQLTTVLKVLSPGFLLVASLHLALGVRADVTLGAQLPPAVLADATLDSQNRFYGVAFGLYGVLLYVCAADLARYALIVRCVLWAFFAGGLARIVSLATHGWPPPAVLGLLALELAAPPLLHAWLNQALKSAER